MPTTPLVPSTWQLPDSFRKRLGKSAGRQRIFVDAGQLLIIAHHVPVAGQATRQGVLFWRDEKGHWKASSGERNPQPVAAHLDSYEKRLDEFEQLEAATIRSDQYMTLLDNLSPLVRSLRNFHNVLQEARTALNDAHELIDLRDRAYELSRRAELLHQDAKNSMDVAVIRKAEEQAASQAKMEQAAHRLNRMVALFLPLMTLAALFSTPFANAWGWAEHPLGFAAFLSIGLVAGFALLAFISRK